MDKKNNDQFSSNEWKEVFIRFKLFSMDATSFEDTYSMLERSFSASCTAGPTLEITHSAKTVSVFKRFCNASRLWRRFVRWATLVLNSASRSLNFSMGFSTFTVNISASLGSRQSMLAKLFFKYIKYSLHSRWRYTSTSSSVLQCNFVLRYMLSMIPRIDVSIMSAMEPIIITCEKPNALYVFSDCFRRLASSSHTLSSSILLRSAIGSEKNSCCNKILKSKMCKREKITIQKSKTNERQLIQILKLRYFIDNFKNAIIT